MFYVIVRAGVPPRYTTPLPHAYTGDHTLQSVSLSKAHFEAFLRDLLLVKQYRVEVFRRVNNDQSSWKVEFKVSIQLTIYRTSCIMPSIFEQPEHTLI